MLADGGVGNGKTEPSSGIAARRDSTKRLHRLAKSVDFIFMVVVS